MSVGLSVTAIGGRDIERCIEIYNVLEKDMGLKYMELAVGSYAHYLSYFSMPVFLHDKCLRDSNNRLDPYSIAGLAKYKDFTERNNVLGWSIHSSSSPPKTNQAASKWISYIDDISYLVGVQACIELMIGSEYYFNCGSFPDGVPICLDISHINVWAKGDPVLAEETCLEIIEGGLVEEIHISCNNGRADSHDMVPSNHWCYKYIDKWAEDYFVTWESLPVEYEYYERLDKARGRDRF